MRRRVAASALGVLLMWGCSSEAATPRGPVGVRPDPAIADLAPVTVPRPLVGLWPNLADLPVVAIVTGPEAVIAVRLSPGHCAVAVASTLADSGADARFSFRVDAPEEGRPPESGGGDLPAATVAALGPGNLAAARMGGGEVVLFCGGRGAALWLRGAPDQVKVTGAGRARPATRGGDSGHLAVVGPPATVEAALAW